MPQNSYENTQETLERIADVLKYPVSAFYRKNEPPYAQTDNLELLHLWYSIVQEEDRQRVLAYVRWILTEQSRQ